MDPHSLQIPLGLDNPHQVAYHPELKVFGVGCLREEPPNAAGGGSITSSFKLIDALTYERE
jgi:DNA damage-binding protein 1